MIVFLVLAVLTAIAGFLTGWSWLISLQPMHSHNLGKYLFLMAVALFAISAALFHAAGVL